MKATSKWISGKPYLHLCGQVLILKISVDLRLTSQVEPDSGYLSGDFPAIQRKMTHFHVFRVNSRNLSVY
jgi:hypothetical protein